MADNAKTTRLISTCSGTARVVKKRDLISELEKLNIGLRRFTVGLKPFTERWVEAFNLVAGVIEPCLQGAKVFHIGSTAIPGSIAKPILDIGVAYSSSTDFEAETACLVSLGFTSKGEYGIEGRSFFTYYNDEKTYDYIHIHAFREAHPKHLAHLDFLHAHLADPSLVKKYNELKMGLVSSGVKRKDYPEAKNGYVEGVLAQARRRREMER